ncbi:hypothetical protein [Sphingobacterium anhuiense]|uniref:hypothetical protein n=1 Tax=Sphingobacterium anhuiense TaxID=493780 RepID=UPI003C2E451F
MIKAENFISQLILANTYPVAHVNDFSHFQKEIRNLTYLFTYSLETDNEFLNHYCFEYFQELYNSKLAFKFNAEFILGQFALFFNHVKAMHFEQETFYEKLKLQYKTTPFEDTVKRYSTSILLFNTLKLALENQIDEDESKYIIKFISTQNLSAITVIKLRIIAKYMQPSEIQELIRKLPIVKEELIKLDNPEISLLKEMFYNFLTKKEKSFISANKLDVVKNFERLMNNYQKKSESVNDDNTKSAFILNLPLCGEYFLRKQKEKSHNTIYLIFY